MATTKHAHSLVIDYGEESGFTDSFRGIKNQKIFKGDQILDYTGECDLSCYVNFRLLTKVIRSFQSLQVGGIITQGEYLSLLQIQNRMKILQSNTQDTKRKKILEKQVERLVDPNQMGQTYKVLYFHKSNDKPAYPFLPEILNP